MWTRYDDPTTERNGPRFRFTADRRWLVGEFAGRWYVTTPEPVTAFGPYATEADAKAAVEATFAAFARKAA